MTATTFVIMDEEDRADFQSCLESCLGHLHWYENEYGLTISDQRNFVHVFNMEWGELLLYTADYLPDLYALKAIGRKFRKPYIRQLETSNLEIVNTLVGFLFENMQAEIFLDNDGGLYLDKERFLEFRERGVDWRYLDGEAYPALQV